MFTVHASGDIVDDLYLSCLNLPPGATFPIVQGVQNIQSTFTWTNNGTYSGILEFTILRNNTDILCSLNLDWALPVELTSFTASVLDNDVTLKWKTGSEINNSGFEIEKAKVLNGKSPDWVKSGVVSGNGSTSSSSDYEYTDKGISTSEYKYRLKQIDYNGNFEYFYLSEIVRIGIPSEFELSQNYPNPFNPTTNMEFGISELGFVSLKVYDASGKEVAALVNEVKPAGYYSVSFSATGGGVGLSSGIYFYTLSSGNFKSTKRMILLK